MSVEHKLITSGVRLLARELVSGREYTYKELVYMVSGRMSPANVAQSLLRLSRDGIVENVRRGIWKVL